MTQQQQIRLLESIMPEISETKDPEGVMLKCAKKHNLSLAQLEKLGHVFNTAKSLACFKKQASRGDSFTIVNVPEMCRKYASVDLSSKPSRKEASNHHRLTTWADDANDQIAMEARYWTETFNRKSASFNKQADNFNIAGRSFQAPDMKDAAVGGIGMGSGMDDNARRVQNPAPAFQAPTPQTQSPAHQPQAPTPLRLPNSYMGALSNVLAKKPEITPEALGQPAQKKEEIIDPRLGVGGILGIQHGHVKDSNANVPVPQVPVPVSQPRNSINTTLNNNKPRPVPPSAGTYTEEDQVNSRLGQIGLGPHGTAPIYRKSASSKNVPSLNNIISDMWKQSDGGAFYKDESQGNQYIEFEPEYGRKPDITFDKTAGFIEDLHGMRKSAKEAVELYKQIKDEAILNVAADCKKIANAMYFHDADWKDIAYDIHDGMPDKAASVVNLVEAYFNKNNVIFTPAEIEKKAYVRSICRDRYGLMSTFKDIIENNEMYKDACTKLEILNRPKTPDHGEKMAALLDAMQRPNDIANQMKDMGLDDKTKMERKRDDAIATAKRNAALQQLIMSDPVLSNADHAQVEDLFNTISNVSPDLAKDPNFIGPVLKEAIQYGSIPVQQLKDLLSVQLDANRIKVTEKQLESGKFNSAI